MDWLSLLLRRSGTRDHVTVFADFRRAVGSILTTARGRPSPRIIDPFDWMNR